MIALISDIHGNYEALKKVLERIDELEIVDIFCIGDVVGYYSQVNECCDELRKRSVRCVMGNHDWYMVSGTKCPRSHSVNDCLDYQRKIITKENLEWIKTFPVMMSFQNIKMVHGGWVNPIDEYLEPTDEYFENVEGSFFVSGHTHFPCIKRFGNKIFCNPGSVGQPRDNDNRAAFIILEENEIELVRVEYDYKKVGKLMDEAGFNDYYYGCLRDGARNLHR